MKFRQLEIYAQQYGYSVEKTGRVYQWWHNEDHSIIGECKTIRECYNDIRGDVLSKVELALSIDGPIRYGAILP